MFVNGVKELYFSNYLMHEGGYSPGTVPTGPTLRAGASWLDRGVFRNKIAGGGIWNFFALPSIQLLYVQEVVTLQVETETSGNRFRDYTEIMLIICAVIRLQNQ